MQIKGHKSLQSKLNHHRIEINVHKWPLNTLDVQNLFFIKLNLHHKQEKIMYKEILQHHACQNKK